MLSAARPVHRRAAVVLAATALAALPVPAFAATPDTGRASAVTAELTLDVSLLNNAVDVPVDVALNKVQSPAEAHGAMLTADVAGVGQSGPIDLVRAEVGSSVTHVDAQGANASVQLVNANVNVPGLPGSALLGLQALGSSVSCPVDGQPTANVTSPAKLTVLGHSVTLKLDGTTQVSVPGVGEVDIDFSPRSTTSTSAAAAALTVRVALNPLNLNVAKVSGTITVASVSCQKPTGAGGGPSGSATPSAPASVSAPSAGPSGSSNPSSPSNPAAPSGSGSSGSGSSGGPSVGAAAGAPSAGGPASTGGAGSSGGAGAPVSGDPVAQLAAGGSGAPSAAASGSPAPSVASGGTSKASGLAFTGAAGTIPALAGGSALVVVGVATVLLARRRRAAHRR
ncbi:SCO1860 family LAETG-anchored protein [Kitasatospora sp. NPDC008050]|uniref:SCO1860 family LAETG-anchored protein n=1 Tax=Kitasatospora sp. NPDC008050 TaxID=3364021 RepID=UPI0036E75CBA